jgi:hypothetical protein
MVSATFGNELWSTQGAGISRVQKAIKVRSGPTVKLVVQNLKEMTARKKEVNLSADVKKARFLAEAAQRESLLKEIEQDNKEAVKSGFGLFKKNFGLWD